MVIATQNPIEQAGTYRLPEAQLDRFLMKTSVGYPDHEATIAVLADAKARDRAKPLEPVSSRATSSSTWRALADEVHVDPAILGYVSRIAEASRRHPSLKLGLSVRGCLAYVRCAKTWAASQGRTYVVPDDIKMLAEPVLSHRLLLDAEAQFAGTTVIQVIDQILGDIAPSGQRAAPPASGAVCRRRRYASNRARRAAEAARQELLAAGATTAAERTLHRTANPAGLTPHASTRIPEPGSTGVAPSSTDHRRSLGPDAAATRRARRELPAARSARAGRSGRPDARWPSAPAGSWRPVAGGACAGSRRWAGRSSRSGVRLLVRRRPVRAGPSCSWSRAAALVLVAICFALASAAPRSASTPRSTRAGSSSASPRPAASS